MKIHFITGFSKTLRLPIVACWSLTGHDSSENPDHTTCGNCKHTRAWKEAQERRRETG